MASRPWPWLRNAIFGLTTRPVGWVPAGDRLLPVYPNRLQGVLAPPWPTSSAPDRDD